MEYGDMNAAPVCRDRPDFQLTAAEFKRLVRQTVFAAALEPLHDPLRYPLHAILINADPSMVAFVASDVRRLAIATTDRIATMSSSAPVETLVHYKSLAAFRSLSPRRRELASFWVGTDHVQVEVGGKVHHTPTVAGTFPSYRDVIPMSADKLITAGTADLLAACRKAMSGVADEQRFLRITLAGGRVELAGFGRDGGVGQVVDLPCRCEGGDLVIGVNPIFLIEPLKVAPTDEVTLEITEANRPVLLSAGPRFTYVVMPVNLNPATVTAVVPGVKR